MKKFLLLPLIAMFMFMGASPASATGEFDLPDFEFDICDILPFLPECQEEPEQDLPPEYDGEKKATICHWANGNVHAISISIHALATHLVWHAEGGWNANPGHEGDEFLHFGKEVKPDDDEECQPDPELLSAFVCFEGEITTLTDEDQTALNLKVSAFLELNDGAEQVLSADAECEVPVTTTTTTAPPVIIEKEVVKVVEVPGPVQVVEKLVQVPAPVSTPLPAAAPATELPRTGSGALGLLFGGLSMVCAGSAMRALSKLRRANA